MQGGNLRRVHGGILADGCDGFQRHVAVRDHPLVVLLQHQNAEASNGWLVMENADEIRSALDLLIEAFNALVEIINGQFKAEVFCRRGPWRGFEAVEYRLSCRSRIEQGKLIERPQCDALMDGGRNLPQTRFLERHEP